MKKPKRPAREKMTELDRYNLNALAAAAFPTALAEFYRTGGTGETWEDYDDLADSVYLAARAMLRRSKQP